VLLKVFGNNPSDKVISSGSSASGVDRFQDGAARRELQQRGFRRMWWSNRNN
jgi:hypothetical protein